MKKIGSLTVAITLGLLGLSSGNLRAVNTNAMLINIQISGLIQNTAVATNAGVVTTTYTTSVAKLGNADILEMLQAEYGTLFPTGAQLGYNLTGKSGFVVLDQNQNLILNVATNPADGGYGFGLSNNVTGASSPQIQVGKDVNNKLTTNDVVTAIQTVADYGISYKDSHGNNFHLDGLLVLKVSGVVTSSTTTYTSASFTLTGYGGGKFFNSKDGLIDSAAFTKAKVTASGKNLIQ